MMSDPAMGYTLALKPGAVWADGPMLRPDLLGGLAPDALRARLGDAFDIQGQPGEVLSVRGLGAIHGLGAHMAHGTLIIHGHAGDDLGAAMSGGTIHVHGDAGDCIGGPCLGVYDRHLPDEVKQHRASRGLSRQGMTGGRIVVHGDAGDYAGLRMRRGMIAIAGHAGHSPGYRMIAGSVVVGQGDLHQPGLEMQRGTIVSLSPEAGIHTAGRFRTDSTLEASAAAVIGLMLNELRKLDITIAPELFEGRWRLASGDVMQSGKGEIWQCVQ